MSEEPKCSFCGDAAKQVDCLIAAGSPTEPGAMICEYCVVVCVEVLAKRRAAVELFALIGPSKRMRDNRPGPGSVADRKALEAASSPPSIVRHEPSVVQPPPSERAVSRDIASLNARVDRLERGGEAPKDDLPAVIAYMSAVVAEWPCGVTELRHESVVCQGDGSVMEAVRYRLSVPSGGAQEVIDGQSRIHRRLEIATPDMVGRVALEELV